jgi:hypothetical protein
MLDKIIAWYKANHVSRYVIAALAACAGTVVANAFIAPEFPRFVIFAVLYAIVAILTQFFGERNKPAADSPPRNGRRDVSFPKVEPRQAGDRPTDGTA